MSMMRLALLFVLSIQILGSCQSNQRDLYGKWYAPHFGLLIIDQHSMQFYPRSTPAETWGLDPQENQYIYRGSYFTHCKLNNPDSNLYVIPQKEGPDLIRLKSNRPCVFSNPFYDGQLLHRLPEIKQVKFEYISILKYDGNKYREVRLSMEDIRTIKTESNLLSIDEQLWIIFASGMDFSMGDHLPHYQLRFVAENYHVEKRVGAVVAPTMIEGLMKKIQKDFNRQKE